MAVGDGWTLGRMIGSGATSTVSLAAAASSGDLFAVKSSHISRSALLQREQSILSSLSSPYIISCLGSAVSVDSYHIFLELAGAGDLFNLAGFLDEPKIQYFTRQILLALHYLHSNGIAHCDVKGKNILIGLDGRAKLGDFGCARRVGSGGLVMGTPAFMAPEVVRGEHQGISGDVWSLGCTVVEMATGKSPWPEDVNPVAVIRRIEFSSDVPAMPEWISEKGKDFVSKCLQRNSKERWTVEQLLRHPFVEKADECSVLPCFSSKQGKWVSPKSNLNFSFWDSETEEEEGLVSVKENSAERIRQLESPTANWTWDDSWISVRRSADECNPETTPEFKFGDAMDSEGKGRGKDCTADCWDQDVFSCSDSMDCAVEKMDSASFVYELEAGDVTEHFLIGCNGLNYDLKEFQTPYYILWSGALFSKLLFYFPSSIFLFLFSLKIVFFIG